MTTCLYHAGCPDGYTSAWLVARALATPMHPVRLIPVNYDEPIPDEAWEPDDDLYIVDFSYHPDRVESLCRTPGRVVHLWDHHQSAIDQWRAWLTGVVDVDESGIRILYCHFEPSHGNVLIHANLDLVLDVTRSGAGIVYNEFANAIDVAAWDALADRFGVAHLNSVYDLVSRVQDRDLWNWAYPDTCGGR